MTSVRDDRNAGGAADEGAGGAGEFRDVEGAA